MLTARRAVALAAVVALPLLLLAAGGAGATTQRGVDLSSTAAIQSYLTSHGIDPATVTWQEGLLNYAGPNCPGASWNCTTSTSVVQVAQPGGENRFECEPSTTGTEETTNTCVSVAAGDTNHARCFLSDTDPVTTQTCTIGQEGDRNTADVDMTIVQRDGSDQGAEQDANVQQTATERNQVQVKQTVRQRSTTGTSQSQEAQQLAYVDQEATGSDNFSHVHQALDQDESGNATVQTQNTDAQPLCFAKNANQCAQVFQDVSDADGGINQSHLQQQIGERQTTTALTPTQTQGLVVNGQEGHVHQSNPDDLGQSHDSSHEQLSQRQASPGGVSNQHQSTDPRCCGISQVGGGLNRENIDQATTQSADEQGAVQFSNLYGEAHQVPEDGEQPETPTPDNHCSIDQHGRNNSDADHFSMSGEGVECLTLILDTTCTSGIEGGICEATPTCDESCVESLLIEPLTPTLGADIAMPDYTSDPPDYVDPGGWW